MAVAKQGAEGVREGSTGSPAVGGSDNTGSPTEPNPKQSELQNNEALLNQLAEQNRLLAAQNAKLMEMQEESQRHIGKLGNEIGQLRRQQPAITPEMNRQFKTLIEDPETALNAINVVAQTAANSAFATEHSVLDAFYTVKASDKSFDGVSFDEFKWKALKSGVNLSELADPSSVKNMMRTIVASRPLDVEAIRAAAKEEGKREGEERLKALLKEKGIADLSFQSTSDGGDSIHTTTDRPLSDDEEQEKMGLLMGIGAGQISKSQIPEAKRLRYGIR